MRRRIVAGVGVMAIVFVVGAGLWPLLFPGSCPYPEVLKGYCPFCWCGLP